MSIIISLATSNPGKTKEASDILKARGLSLTPLGKFVEVVEDGITFEDNARLKASANARLNNSYCIGEDSGIEIDFLNGAPGVFSARFSEEPGENLTREEREDKNNQKVLTLLADTTNRGGKYVCAIALANPQGEIIFTCRGENFLTINHTPKRGNGFGYDFICSPTEDPSRYFSELSAEEKNRISHRGKAWEKLLHFIDEKGSGIFFQ